MLKNIRLIKLRVRAPQPLLQLAARGAIPAFQAHDAGDIAVEIDHPGTARSGVQPVDVLRDHSGQPDRFQVGQGTMSRVRFSPAYSAPAEVGTGPVATLSIRRAGELAVLHRRGAYRGWPAIVRDPRVGRHAGAGEGDPAPAAEQCCGRRNGSWSCHCHASTVPCKINTQEFCLRLRIAGWALMLPLAQLIVPVPLSRRAASAIEPVIEGYTVNDSET
jgi:hypothetical protein